jgi:hypothetical protein
VIKDRKASRDKTNDIKLSTNDIGIKTRKAFLDLLLDVANENENFSEQDIIDEVNTFMFAVSIFQFKTSITVLIVIN